jgi:hypothetical protein
MLLPTTGLMLGASAQRSTLKLERSELGVSQRELRPGLALGLVHPVPQPAACCLQLEGHASLGLGATLISGHAQLTLRDDWVLLWPVQRWLSFRAGLGLGVSVDLNDGARNQLELGVPLSVALGDLEIVYRPGLHIPLASETRAVFGGELSRSAALAFMPFEVQLRMRWTGLAW